MGRGSRDAILFATLALTSPFWAGGCDIVQGFQNAGDALFPPQKTYLEAPGFRLAEGRFHRLNVGVGDELYLLARDADPTAEPALYSMRFVDPKPCKIPGVGRYWSSGLPTKFPSQIVYLADNARRGTVHFADARCKVHDLTLEDADLPYEESESGLLIQSGTDLVLVNPPEERKRTVASGVQAILLNGPGAHFLIIDGRFEAYTPGTWEHLGSAGKDVGIPRGLGGNYIYEDATGIHTVSAASGSVDVDDINADGCRLGWTSGSMIAYYSSCADRTLAMYDASTSKTTDVDYDADPGVFAVELDKGKDRSSARLDRDYWFYSLRDLESGGNTLWIRNPDGEEFVVGSGARLDRTKLDDSGDFGLALVDVSVETGRLVRWKRDGSVETLANDVLYGSEFLVNFNGVVGDRARVTKEGELEILLERVPRRDYEYQDQTHRWRALFDESDGVTGTLSIDESGSTTYANRKVIARGVRHPRHQFLDVVLPGIAYVSNYDPVTDTGRLEYNNLELLFRGIISEGVSDFIPAGNGILYTVPFGEARGVWIARAQ
ncbi:MAG TPA: hypothetical protein VMS65_04975 [Polyangiaceae bacterium]|nr:hypothetical protein [Polyangiaceae bacterium]